jgi:hypothetical protein
MTINAGKAFSRRLHDAKKLTSNAENASGFVSGMDSRQLLSFVQGQRRLPF